MSPTTLHPIPARSVTEGWETVALSDAGTPGWQLAEGGAIRQVASVGTTANATGTLLVHSEPLTPESGELSLSCGPGTAYQTGLVFHYTDPSSFRIFLIDRKSPNYASYDYVVGEVRNGRFASLCTERYFDAPPKLLELTIRAEAWGLHFLVGEDTVYRWPDGRLEPGSRCGLYSQRNTDAAFLGLRVTPRSALATGISKGPPPEREAGAAQPASPMDGYLRIQPPRSTTVIEFKEPFGVSLDSLYLSLYLNSELARPREADGGRRTSRSVLLDYRPKRWYRELKNARQAIRLAEYEVARRQSALDLLENQGAYPQAILDAPSAAETSQTDGEAEAGDGPDAVVLDLGRIERYEQAIMQARKHSLLAQDKLEQLVEARNGLLQELRLAGYRLDEAGTPEQTSAAGFDFHIVGGIAGYTDFTPVYVSPTADLADKSVWESVKQRLDAALQDRLSSGALERYRTQGESLADPSSFLPTIQGELAAIDAEFETVRHGLEQIEGQRQAVRAEIGNWEHDRALLEDANVQFRAYDESEYRISGTGTGQHNNENFKQWLAANASQLATFRYEFSASGSNYSVAIDRYPGFEWYHEYNLLIETHEWDETVYEPDPLFGAIIQHPRVVHHKRVDYDYLFQGDRNIKNFFDTAKRLADHYIGTLLPQEEEKLARRAVTLGNNIVALEKQRADLEANGLPLARAEFLEEWNRADVIEATLAPEALRPIDPDSDPLSDLVRELTASEGEVPKVYGLEFRSDGYYTQDGQSLLDFVDVAGRMPHLAVLLVPVFDRHGRRLPEVAKAIVNPTRSARLARVPSIAFVETYRTEVVWKGYCLGELARSVNLFPGEEKEIVVERKTRRLEKLSTTESRETIRSAKTTTLFEEKLEDELVEKNRAALSSSFTAAQDRKHEVSRVLTDEHRQTDSLTASLKLSGKITGSVDKEGSYEKKDDDEKFSYGEDRKRSRSRGFGASIEAGREVTDAQTDQKTDSVIVSRNQTHQRASEESRESMKKSLANRLRRVASETSAENKVSFSTVKSEEIEETTAETETLRVSNPNAGRTLNYHFYQLQNVYELSTDLVDVQIVLDPGIEVIQESDVSDLRVFDLEEFGRIFCNCDEEDPRMALLAGIVARQVVKNYTSFEKDPRQRKDVIRLAGAAPVDLAMFSVLNLSNEWPAEQALQESLIAPLRDALAHLKSRSFRFVRTPFLPAQTVTVNAGSYYMDSEVGSRPATEDYLERRRDIETDRQRAELDHLRAQTQERVFFPRIPESVTELNMPLNGSGRR